MEIKPVGVQIKNTGKSLFDKVRYHYAYSLKYNAQLSAMMRRTLTFFEMRQHIFVDVERYAFFSGNFKLD